MNQDLELKTDLLTPFDNEQNDFHIINEINPVEFNIAFNNKNLKSIR